MSLSTWDPAVVIIINMGELGVLVLVVDDVGDEAIVGDVAVVIIEVGDMAVVVVIGVVVMVVYQVGVVGPVYVPAQHHSRSSETQRSSCTTFGDTKRLLHPSLVEGGRPSGSLRGA